MSVTSQYDEYRQKIIDLTKNPMMSQYTGQKIVERLTEKDLMKLDKIMKKHPTFNITTFLRIFRNMLRPTQEEDFYLTYALFRLFQEICLSCKSHQVNFNNINSIISQKMPYQNQDIRFSQKLYPLSYEVPESLKKKIAAPQVIGKVIQERERLEEQPYQYDKFIHFNRKIAQSFYSAPNHMYISLDNASTDIMLLDDKLELIKTVRTDQQLSKRDAVITWIAWSEHEQQIAALLGNYSLSLWAKQDHFRFEVNIPLPSSLLLTPYVMIGYMESSRIWYAINDRPAIFILSSKDYLPEYKFTHFKMIKEHQSEKMMTVDMKYRKLLCLAFQNNVFLISLQKRELINQLKTLPHNITSLAFSETYQALFVSTYQNHFYSFELTDHLDLNPKGKFEGHKSHVSIVGVLEEKPVMYSIDETSVTKLWDIRDFSCYQTFHSIKNVEFSQTFSVSDGVCLVGSKHFCYRWKHFRTFQESQKIVYITQLQKNILMVTGKEVRVYSHNNGLLMRVLKGVFDYDLIVKALLLDVRKMIMLVNQEGTAKVYNTKDFSYHTTFHLPPKPHSLYYERQTQLLTFICMGEVRIHQFKDTITLPLKRRLHNKQDFLKVCQISPSHDFIVMQYEFSPYLVFYSYERAKYEGYIEIEQVLKVRLVPYKNIFYILCKEKLLICTYNKTIHSTSFFIKNTISLWQSSAIEENRIHFIMKPFSKIESTDLVFFHNKLIVTSNDACFHCLISIQESQLNSQDVKIVKENYNPYRIGSQDFLESFDPKKKSIIIDQKIEKLIIQKRYIKHPGIKIFVYLAKISQFYCVADQKEVIFYDQQGRKRGTIEFKQTLPKNWDLHNYSEQQFKELEFVLEFIQREKPKPKQETEDNFYFTSSILSTYNNKKEDNQIITMGMLSGNYASKGMRSKSLREKKMILEKERDQKEKEEKFQELRKEEEIAKFNNLKLSSNQKYMSQSLAFLNVNRNKLLLTKGTPEPDLPQIRALEFKLNSMINKDQKKSMVSKYSGGQEASPIRQTIQEQVSKEMTRTTVDLRLMPDKQQKESYKDQIKRLDMSLRQSKFKKPSRSGSLPILKRSQK